MVGKVPDFPSRPRRSALGPAKGIPYQFAPVPVEMTCDTSISDGAYRAYGNMMAIRKNDLCTISLKRLAERLGKTERTAFAYVHELISGRYIEPINPKNGRCGRYRLVALSPANGFSGTNSPEGQPLKSLARITANGFSGTIANGFSHPRSIDYLPREDDVEKKNRENAARQGLLEMLADLQPNLVDAEKEVDWLLRRHQQSHSILFGHLRDAINSKHPKPIEYADEQTSRGAVPSLSYHGLMASKR
jgi:hypothetical protein